MITKISNEWISLLEKRNGVTVQRKFGGINTEISIIDEVSYCIIKYWERELYPNNEIIKTELKTYLLEDLAYTETTIAGIVYSMQPLAVLSGFVQSVGIPSIINPSRVTLTDTVKLPLNAKSDYKLHLDTRVKTVKP